MPFDAVFFDFDGTLADSYDAIAASVNHLRALRGHEAMPTDVVKIHVGRGLEYLLTRAVPGTNLTVDADRYRAHHPTIMAAHTRLLPGAEEVLRTFHAAGKQIALCSNKPRIFSTQLLAHLGIAELFHAVIGPEDVPRQKPAPDMILAAMKRLGISPVRVLYVGDMVVDIETARAANVAVWIVPTGSDTLETLTAAKPDRMLGCLADLLTANL